MQILKLVFTFLLFVSSSGAFAAEACWEVVMPQPYDYTAKQAIKINKCTGETWVLVPTLDKNGRISSDTWVPIETQKPVPHASASDKQH